MKKTLLNITVLVVLLFGTIMVATAQRTSKAVEEALDAIVALEIEDAQGRRMPRGLGFFVTSDQVATRLTNITDFTQKGGAHKIYVRPVGKRRRLAVESVSARDRVHDLVLLKVPVPYVKPLTLSDKVQHRGPVYTLSDPTKRRLIKGMIKDSVTLTVNSRSDEYIAISNPTALENRGGPVLNNKGEVVGIPISLSDLSGNIRYRDGTTSITITGSNNSINIGNIGSTLAVTSKVLATLLADIDGKSSHPRRQNEKADKWIPTPTESPNRIEKTYHVNPGGRLTIDAEMGNINVQTAAQDRVEVVVTKEAKSRLHRFQEALDDFKVTFDQRGSNIYIQGKFGRGRNYWQRQLNDLKIRFQVTVPRQYNVDLNT